MIHAHEPTERSGEDKWPKNAAPLNSKMNTTNGQFSAERAVRCAWPVGRGGATSGLSRTKRRGAKLAQSSQIETATTTTTLNVLSAQSCGANAFEMAVQTMMARTTDPTVFHRPLLPATRRQFSTKVSKHFGRHQFTSSFGGSVIEVATINWRKCLGECANRIRHRLPPLRLLMMANNLIDHTPQEFFAEVGVELGIHGQGAQAGDLAFLAGGV